MAERIIRYRQAKPGDVTAIKELYDHVLPVPYSEQFYATLTTGIKTGSLAAAGTAGASTQCMVIVAIDDGHLVGCIATTTMSLQEARTAPEGVKPKLGFDLLDKMTADSKAAYILTIGVLPKYRQRGIGKELIFEGLRRLIEKDKNIECSFLHTLESDTGACAFFEDTGFVSFGRVPNHYAQIKGSPAARVYARPFHDGELAQYQEQKGSAIIDLTSPALARVKKTPKWMRDLFCQFLLPIGLVAALFGVSYLLVLAGPLRGISNKFMKMPTEGPSDELDPTQPEL